MAGYYNFSKSNNALDAEEQGRFPASVLAKRLGVKTGAIRALMTTREWHHTSSRFNATDYYSENAALEIIDELKAWKPAAKAEQTFENCTGHYLLWGGTRNHPKATEIKFGPITVTRKGDWFTLHFPTTTLRKNVNTRGFHLVASNGKSLVANF